MAARQTKTAKAYAAIVGGGNLMPELSPRELIAIRAMVDLWKTTQSDDLKNFIRDVFGGKPQEEGGWYYGPFYHLFATMGMLMDDPDGYSGKDVCGEVIGSLSAALKKETGTPLCADDIANSSRITPMKITLVRYYAYPYIRDILRANHEWFSASQLLLKRTFRDYAPQTTLLRVILGEACECYTDRLREPDAAYSPFGYANNYLAPSLWPASQRADAIAVRAAIKKIQSDVRNGSDEKPDIPLTCFQKEASFLYFIQKFLDETEAAFRPALRVMGGRDALPRPSPVTPG